MNRFSTLNVNEGGRKVLRPAPSRAEIEEFEIFFGVKLPELYVELLNYSNGGHPEWDAFIPDDLQEVGHVCGVNRFYHLGQDRDNTENLWYAATRWHSILGDKCIPIANDGGGDQIYLNLAGDEKSVQMFFIEGQEAIRVAASVEAFIGMLFLDPDEG